MARLPRRARRPDPVAGCDDVREALSAHLDGEDAPLPAAVVDAHLTDCPRCRDFRSAVVGLARTPGLVASKAPPEGFLLQVAGLASRPGRADPRRRAAIFRVRRWATTLGATISAAVFIPLGVSAHTHVVPTRAPSPCTSGLHHGHSDG
jgi:predicted anti-sigma-YlaC factor YlaD